jgi:hypothetical protein
MGSEDNGLTLKGLAQRLEALERENAKLRSKVATLEDSGARRSEVATLRGSGTHQPEEPAPEPVLESAGRVSRRWLFSRAGAATLGVVAAGVLTQRDVREAQATPTSFTTDTSERGAVEGTNTSEGGYGVWGNSSFVGVYGTGAYIGVWGKANPESIGGIGVAGNGEGKGVQGVAESGQGVLGRSNSGTTGAVEGEHLGQGYGGQFQGGRAQLRLVPASAAGRPSGAHSKGEIYMDSAGALFVCVKGGTPGRWRKVTTTTS